MKKFVVVSLLLLFIFSAGRVQATSGFQNPGFETGTLDFWNPIGNVNISTGDVYTSPYGGSSNMAMISYPSENGGGYVYGNHISQDIDASIGAISFWYKFFTWDYDYDIPGFAVLINNNEVFSLNASDADIEYADPIWMTDWRQFSYDLSGLSGTVNLSIFAGNTADINNNFNTLNSWVYIDSVEPVFNPGPGPVPEPSTLVLFLCAGAFLLFLSLRQRRKNICPD